MCVRHKLDRLSLLVAAGLTTLIVTACSAASPTTTAGQAPSGPAAAGPEQVVSVTYASGAVQGGVSRTPVQLGRKVRLVVTSDVADELHVHGYDLKADVPAHGVGTVEFVANLSGVFEVELESKGAQLAQLEIR
jgi:hypothetical protein